MSSDGSEIEEDLGIEEILCAQAAIERRGAARNRIGVSKYWQWKPPAKQFCTMHEGKYGLYLDGKKVVSKDMAGKNKVPVLFIFAALDPIAVDEHENNLCTTTETAMGKMYSKLPKQRLSNEDLWTILGIIEQTADGAQFRSRFEHITRVKVSDQEYWKCKVHDKMISVLNILTKYFYFGELTQKHIRKLIVHFLELSGDPWVEPKLNIAIAHFVTKLFKDQKQGQWALCNEVFASLKRHGGDPSYLHSMLWESSYIWPMQGYSVIFMKTILAEQRAQIRIMRAKKRRKRMAEDYEDTGYAAPRIKEHKTHLTEDDLNDAALPSVQSSIEMDKAISDAVQYISENLPKLVKHWLNEFSDEETYMWLDMVSLGFSLYSISACKDSVSGELESTIEKVMTRLKREKSHSDYIMMKATATLRQVYLVRSLHADRSSKKKEEISLSSLSDAVIELD